jgi:DNA excision repair protein ERCC-2
VTEPTTAPSPSPVAVRELCEFAAKAGDLDRRFTPAPTSDEGIAGHQLVAARRPASQRAEVTVAGVIEGLQLRGRADGFDATLGVVEEVKTHKLPAGGVERIAPNQRALHWAQAKVYGALLAAQHGLPALTVRLCYLHVGTGQETVLEERCSAEALADFATTLARRYAEWARAQQAHRAALEADLAALAFRPEGFRPGQRALSAQVFHAARSGRVLLAQAGTGIGKTIATLFPMLKAMPAQRLDKLFFLTAKGSGHEAPLAALAELPLPRLRMLQLVARDKACEHPGQPCSGEHCPLARGFYDRLPAARAAAAGAGALRREVVRRVALDHGVCPYYLAQEMARWADVVVADVNYLFDATALLHGLTRVNGWRVGLLVDEAHNLVDRARALHSAALARDALRAALQAAPAPGHQPARALRRLQRSMGQLVAAQHDDHALLDALPATLVEHARAVVDAVAAAAADDPAAVSPPLLELHFELMGFVRLAEAFSPKHTLLEVDRRAGARHAVVALRNVVPAPFLQPRWAAMHASVLFSATLTPMDYYADLLGLPEQTARLDLPAPFDAAQLDVRLVPGIPTRWRERAAGAPALAALIGRQYAHAPGNYLAFFASFEHLQQVWAAFTAAHPGVPAWAQSRHMRDAERQAFLDRFTPDGAGIGFAVLGGAFAEGVDLPGSRLVGAFVATLGLPQVNPLNGAMQRLLERQYGAGFDYAYLYPGLRKVVQAAGRVIRTPADRGSLHLIDARFLRAEVRALLPTWWRPRVLPPGADRPMVDTLAPRDPTPPPPPP